MYSMLFFQGIVFVQYCNVLWWNLLHNFGASTQVLSNNSCREIVDESSDTIKREPKKVVWQILVIPQHHLSIHSRRFYLVVLTIYQILFTYIQNIAEGKISTILLSNYWYSNDSIFFKYLVSAVEKYLKANCTNLATLQILQRIVDRVTHLQVSHRLIHTLSHEMMMIHIKNTQNIKKWDGNRR